MSLLTSLLLHGLVLAPLQDGAAPISPAAASLDGEGWILLDGVDTVVNDDVVTGAEFVRAQRRILQRQPVPLTTEEELRAFEDQVRLQLVTRRLRAQAGSKLGAPEAELNQLIEHHFDDLRDRQGLVNYVEDLESRGVTADRVRDQARDDFYAEAWQDREVGLDTLDGQRPHRDRFVRPGEMRHRYERARDLFGAPAAVQLKRFVMIGPPGSTDSEASALCESFRARAEAGETLDVISAEYGPQLSRVIPEEVGIERIGDADLREFAETAQIGSVSKVLITDMPDGTKRYEFFRLERRQEAEPPLPFVDGRVQAELARRTLTVRDQWYLSQGQLRLMDAAYISPAIDLPQDALPGGGPPAGRPGPR